MTSHTRPSSRFSSHQKADLVLLCCLAALVIAYCVDAWTASSHITNLILIAPVTGLALVLCAIEFVRQLRGDVPPPTGLEPVKSVLPVMGLFCGYVLTLVWLGFDVGTFLFIVAFLWVHGERRLAWVFGYSLAFALIISIFFSSMLPYPMPMLILPSAY